MIIKTYKVTSEAGVQARPAAQLVNLANQFTSDILLESYSKTVDLKSIMGVMSLAVKQGAEITITVKGSDEQEALQKLDDFIKGEIAQ